MQIVRASAEGFMPLVPVGARATAGLVAFASGSAEPEARDVDAMDSPGTSSTRERTATATSAKPSDPLQDPAIQRVIAELSARDREVRAHEQAHVAAGGELITSGPSYTYQTGPDRRRYAVGGEVGIDTSPVRGDPEATLAKAARIVAAALAPAQPSSQDYRVVAQANQMTGQARVEIALGRAREAYASSGPSGAGRSAALSVRA